MLFNEYRVTVTFREAGACFVFRYSTGRAEGRVRVRAGDSLDGQSVSVYLGRIRSGSFESGAERRSEEKGDKNNRSDSEVRPGSKRMHSHSCSPLILGAEYGRFVETGSIDSFFRFVERPSDNSTFSTDSSGGNRLYE